MNLRWIVWGVLGLSCLLAGCRTSRSISSTNLHFVYRKDAVNLHPEFVAYHETDSTSRIYFRVNTADLLYAKTEGTSFQLAKLRLHYRLYPSYEAEEFLDSASTILTDYGRPGSSRDLIASFRVKAKGKQNYLLVITCDDLVRKERTEHFLVLEKTSALSRQNYLLRDVQSGAPLFQPHRPPADSVLITYNRETTGLHVRHYNRDFPIAPAPFALYNPKPFNYRADSLFYLRARDSNTVVLHLDRPGFFHLSTEQDSKSGVSIFQFPKHFPATKEAEELLPPLRYITTRAEFNDLTTQASAKAALDEFWLNSTSNQERARELIRKFYNRVQDANTYFTSYQEGWKTDRGMIYIVFGTPNVIYRSSNTESWVYGEENNYLSLTINFVKVNNPFTPNDYRLNRSPIYKPNWYRSVESWRQGRILVNN